MESLTQEILDLVKIKMRKQGAYTLDSYKGLIEETIEYFKGKGKLIDDDADEFIEDKLINMWSEVEKEFVE